MIQRSIGDGSFPSGTAIAVPGPAGAVAEVPVETLASGDLVVTQAGPARLRQVATRTIEPGAGGTSSTMTPVLVEAGALGDGLPRRALLLPAEQVLHFRDAVVAEGVLVSLGALVNGRTIRRVPQTAPVTWHRIEVEAQAVLRAEGAAIAARHDPALEPVAPFLPPGPSMFALRSRLAELAPPGAPAPVAPAVPPPAPLAPVEPPRPPTRPVDPAPTVEAEPPTLRVMANNRDATLLPDSTALVWRFALPVDAAAIQLVSPAGVPANTAPDRRQDARRFGVAIRSLMLDDTPVPLDSPILVDGFHPMEQAGSQSWRWTTGDATMLVPPKPGSRILTVEITDWHALLLRL